MSRCALCGQPIAPTDGGVPTSDGMRVHVACADLVARAAWMRRRALALRDLGLLLAAAAVLLAAGIALPAVTLGGIVGLALHAAAHRRFWHHVTRGVTRPGRGH